MNVLDKTYVVVDSANIKELFNAPDDTISRVVNGVEGLELDYIFSGRMRDSYDDLIIRGQH
jgi:hypothetical protein